MPRGHVRSIFLLLLVVTAVYRFSLLGRGALAFVDETFYFTSVQALQSISTGDVHGAVGDLAAARGRHGAALLQIPVAALQAIPARAGIPASNLRSLLIPSACNVLVSLVSLCLTFGIARRLAGDDWAALTAAVVYALLVNSNLYVRHMLPYDWALALGLLALWIGVRETQTTMTVAVAAVLAGATLTVYTGYFLFVGAIGVAAVAYAWLSRGRSAALRSVVVFSVLAAAVIVAMELMFRAGGRSYLGSLRGVGRDISFTSYGEGWSFLPRYLVEVEGVSGFTLLAGAAVYIVRAARRIAAGEWRAIDCVLLPALAGWMAQGALSAIFERIPLYGRLIHPWMPFLAIALADSLAVVALNLRKAVYAATALVAIGSWAFAARVYWPLEYPPDVLYSRGIDTAKLRPEQMLCELFPGSLYASPSPLNRTTNAPYTTESDYVLLNFCQALPAVPRPKQPAVIPAGATLLFDGPHWMTFPAYAYEGLIPADRAAIEHDGYRLKVLRLEASTRARSH